MDYSDFRGAGMKFPPSVNPATGRFVVAQGEQSVREALYLILMTNQGERWLETSFGSNMLGYTFIDTSPTMLGIMKTEITHNILEQEPRISNINIDISQTGNAGVLNINIMYAIANSNTRGNMVFPFYLNADHAHAEEWEAEEYEDE